MILQVADAARLCRSDAQRRNQAAQNHRRRALDVVVEAHVLVLEVLQEPERVGVAEVLELHLRASEASAKETAREVSERRES